MPRTGVIYVIAEAARCGFAGTPTGATWGRASPRPGPSPARRRGCTSVEIEVDDQEYAPVAGIWELREAVAELYNRLYRQRQRVAVHRGTSASAAAGGRR